MIVAAGDDISVCNSEGDEATAKLLEGIEGTVFTLGDNVAGAQREGGPEAGHTPVGGGHRWQILLYDREPLENGEAYIDETFGVLKLVLGKNSYEWWFVPTNEGEKFTDSGDGKRYWSV